MFNQIWGNIKQCLCLDFRWRNSVWTRRSSPNCRNRSALAERWAAVCTVHNSNTFPTYLFLIKWWLIYLLFRGQPAEKRRSCTGQRQQMTRNCSSLSRNWESTTSLALRRYSRNLLAEISINYDNVAKKKKCWTFVVLPTYVLLPLKCIFFSSL